MKTTRTLNIEDKSDYYFTDMTNLNNFKFDLVKINEIALLNNGFDFALLETNKISPLDNASTIYDINYTKSLSGINTPYLVFNHLSAYFKKSSVNKYLIFASTEKNKVMLENYTRIFNEIKRQIKLINYDKIFMYGKDLTRIKFTTSDNLSYNKLINIPVCVIRVGSISKENDVYYPQVLLRDCFYEYEKNSFSE